MFVAGTSSRLIPTGYRAAPGAIQIRYLISVDIEDIDKICWQIPAQDSFGVVVIGVLMPIVLLDIRRQARADFSEVEKVGVDEASRSNGHVYVTVFADMEQGRVLFVTEGKDHQTLQHFKEDRSSTAATLRM